jgi:hypothetical protein
MHQTKVLISIVILLVVGLHALPILQRLQGDRQTFWPFMAWGMYRNARVPGPIRTETRRIVGVTAKGERETVTTDLLGLSSYALERMYIRPMWTGDFSAARQLTDRLNRKRQDPFIGLRLESETYKITDGGVVKEDNPVITYRVVP